jgi:hypothetical protein
VFKKIVDVKGDGNCGFQVLAEHLGVGEDSYSIIRYTLIKELNNHKSDYMSMFGSETHFKYTKDGLYPSYSMTKIVPKEKWLTLPDMDQIIAIDYNKVVVELTKLENGILETFFLVRSSTT